MCTVHAALTTQISPMCNNYMDIQQGTSKTYSIKDSLHGCPTNITFCQKDLWKISSRSKRVTVQETLEVIYDCESEIENIVSEDGGCNE